MAALLERPVSVRSIVALSPGEASALGDPVRVAMLDLLGVRPMSVDELVVELRRRGLEKAPTTLRYHLERLKSSGLVELAFLREARGAVLRYYAATVRSLHYHLPPGDEAEAAALSAQLSDDLEPRLRSFLRRHASQVEAMALRLRPCPHCPTQHFEEYVLIAVVQRALAELVQRRGLLGGESSVHPTLPERSALPRGGRRRPSMLPRRGGKEVAPRG